MLVFVLFINIKVNEVKNYKVSSESIARNDFSEETLKESERFELPTGNIELPSNDGWYLVDTYERTKIVWETLCNYGGWWGESCPQEKEIVAWILYKEGASLYYYDKILMTRGIRYRFEYFSNDLESFVYQLSAFTPFYNPNGDEYLNDEDWEELFFFKEKEEYLKIVFMVYNTDIRHSDGNYLYWFSESEIITPKSYWGGKVGEDYFIIEDTLGNPFYFTGIPNVRNCAMRGIC